MRYRQFNTCDWILIHLGYRMKRAVCMPCLAELGFQPPLYMYVCMYVYSELSQGLCACLAWPSWATNRHYICMYACIYICELGRVNEMCVGRVGWPTAKRALAELGDQLSVVAALASPALQVCSRELRLVFCLKSVPVISRSDQVRPNSTHFSPKSMPSDFKISLELTHPIDITRIKFMLILCVFLFSIPIVFSNLY